MLEIILVSTSYGQELVENNTYTHAFMFKSAFRKFFSRRREPYFGAYEQVLHKLWVTLLEPPLDGYRSLLSKIIFSATHLWLFTLQVFICLFSLIPLITITCPSHNWGQIYCRINRPL